MPESILIYRLKFHSGLRCGSLAGDVNRQLDFVPGSTILGGLAACVSRLFGPERGSDFARDACLSSLLWMKDGQVYVPRPALGAARPEAEARKRLKAWNWIPFQALSAFVRKGELPEGEPPALFEEEGTTSAALDRATNSAVPFPRKRLRPMPGVEGLLIGVVPEAEAPVFEGGMRLLGDTGIGGERSSGWGHFSPGVFDGPVSGALRTALSGESDLYVTLGAFLPGEQEVTAIEEGAEKSPLVSWGLWRLRGYVGESSDILKPTVTCLSHGAVLPFRPQGKVLDITPEGSPNPVFFNGRPPSLALSA